ncbi:MAG TPA: hypothetical protein VGN64_11505 [Dyadobacter sp.]|jgi:hypothetical protein|nr:hypothetical protein [Dyadobacter sp.]
MEIKYSKTYSLAEMKDRYIGTVGQKTRDKYEKILQAEIEARRVKLKTKQ